MLLGVDPVFLFYRFVWLITFMNIINRYNIIFTYNLNQNDTNTNDINLPGSQWMSNSVHVLLSVQEVSISLPLNPFLHLRVPFFPFSSKSGNHVAFGTDGGPPQSGTVFYIRIWIDSYTVDVTKFQSWPADKY